MSLVKSQLKCHDRTFCNVSNLQPSNFRRFLCGATKADFFFLVTSIMYNSVKKNKTKQNKKNNNKIVDDLLTSTISSVSASKLPRARA